MSSVDGVSAEGIGDHKSGHLGRAQAKADQNGRSAGRTPRARDENAGNFALSKVFSRESDLCVVAGVPVRLLRCSSALYMITGTYRTHFSVFVFLVKRFLNGFDQIINSN